VAYIQATAVEDPWTTVEQFKKAAMNAKEAGFDGVESKLFHGLLLTGKC
jgi:2,4-dienoyl-CoA reductase-like NADH-dependent reductase (Old Yellow Enzyme family)